MVANTMVTPAGSSSARNLWSWGLLALIAGLVLTPLGALLYGSLRTHSPGSRRATWTLENLQNVYAGLFNGGWTQAATLNSMGLALPVMLISCGLGVFLAWAVSRTDVPGKRFFEIGFLLPMLYSPLVGVIGWTVLADPRAGLLNVWWQALTGAEAPLFNVYSWGAIIVVMVFYFIPYAFILNVGTFRAMDPALEEAAEISGANLWKRLMHITLPIMIGSIAAAGLFIFTLALEQFAIPGFLGSHIRLETLAYEIYNRTNHYPSDLPGAAAAGSLLLALSAIGLYWYRRLTRRAERFVTVTARGYKPALTALGRLKWPVFLVCAFTFVVGIAVPLAAVLLRALLPVRTTGLQMADFGVQNFERLFQAEDMMLGLRNSVFLAMGTATLCALLGLLIAYRMVRRTSKPLALADYLIAMPIGIPGTVFGVGMLWAYVSTPLYLTLWILMLAFVIRYLVYGVRTTSNGLMQIDRTLEEAATIAGASPLRTFIFVNLPLLKPVIASTWLLVFMIVMREISASIILSGVNSVTLPILTWGYLVDGSYGIASALAILQLILVGAIVLVFRWLFGVDVRTRSHD